MIDRSKSSSALLGLALLQARQTAHVEAARIVAGHAHEVLGVGHGGLQPAEVEQRRAPQNVGVDRAGVQLDGAIEVGGGLLELAFAKEHLASVEVDLGVVGIDGGDAVERGHGCRPCRPCGTASRPARTAWRRRSPARWGSPGGLRRRLELRRGAAGAATTAGLAGAELTPAPACLRATAASLSLLGDGVVGLNGQDAGVVRDREVVVAFDLVGVATLHQREDVLRAESDRPVEVGERAVDLALEAIHAPARAVGERCRGVDRDRLVEVRLSRARSRPSARRCSRDWRAR